MGHSNTITIEEFSAALEESSPLIIDVRSAKEYNSFHLKGAISTPLPSLSPASLAALQQTLTAQGKPVYILCRSGVRAKTAAQILAKDGNFPGYIVEGGTLACDKFGMRIIRNNGLTSSNWQISTFIIFLVFAVMFLGILLMYFGIIKV